VLPGFFMSTESHAANSTSTPRVNGYDQVPNVTVHVPGFVCRKGIDRQIRT